MLLAGLVQAADDNLLEKGQDEHEAGHRKQKATSGREQHFRRVQLDNVKSV